MALWKARALSPEQKLQLVEEESETKMIQSEESGSFLGLEDVSLSEVYSAALPIPVSSPFLCMHEKFFLVLYIGDMKIFKFYLFLFASP